MGNVYFYVQKYMNLKTTYYLYYLLYRLFKLYVYFILSIYIIITFIFLSNLTETYKVTKYNCKFGYNQKD